MRLKPGGKNEEAKGEKIVDPSSWSNGIVQVSGGSAGLKSFGPYQSVIGPDDGQESAYFKLI